MRKLFILDVNTQKTVQLGVLINGVDLWQKEQLAHNQSRLINSEKKNFMNHTKTWFFGNKL